MQPSKEAMEAAQARDFHKMAGKTVDSWESSDTARCGYNDDEGEHLAPIDCHDCQVDAVEGAILVAYREGLKRAAEIARGAYEEELSGRSTMNPMSWAPVEVKACMLDAIERAVQAEPEGEKR